MYPWRCSHIVLCVDDTEFTFVSGVFRKVRLGKWNFVYVITM